MTATAQLLAAAAAAAVLTTAWGKSDPLDAEMAARAVLAGACPTRSPTPARSKPCECCA